MTTRPSGTGQFRKLFFNKKHSDEYGVRWELSTIKVLLWMVVVTLFLIIAFSFFVQDQAGYLASVLFYGIVIMFIIIIVWVVGNVVFKSRKFLAAFLLTLIILFAVYYVLGVIFNSLLQWDFHYGLSTFIAVVVLAGIGARLWNDKLERKDVFVWLIVLVVFIFGNAPAFANGGLLAELDNFLGTVIDVLSKLIHPSDLIAQ